MKKSKEPSKKTKKRVQPSLDSGLRLRLPRGTAPNSGIPFFAAVALVAKLFESLGVEASERVVLYAVTDLDWVPANFTVFDIVLMANR
jgi:hypothetical protein